MSTRRVLRTVRSLRLERGGASPMDLAYTVYAGTLTVLIVGIPVLRAIVLELAEPVAAAALRAHGPTAAAGIAGLAALALLVAGGARGPALLSPFLTAALAGSGLPRAAVLGRPFARAALGLAAITGLVALLPGLALLVAGDADPWPVAAWTAGGALVGVILAGCWLAGQRLGAVGRAVGGAALLGSTALAVLVPTALVPWTAVRALFPAADTGTGAWPPAAGVGSALGVLAALAVAVLAAAPTLLRGLRGPGLLAQARRWQTATTLATTGDLAMAAGGFRPVPRIGRGWGAVRGRSPVTLLIWRDLVGAVRTPVRATAGCLGVAASGALIAVALDGAGTWLVIPALGAALVGFLALGVGADGFRHVVDVASSPPLYGIPTERLLLLHAALPAAAGVACALVGAGIAVVDGAGPVALVVAPAVALLLVVVRAFDAAKGPLPLAVMAPVVTPAGDASALVIAAWQADALLLAGGSTLAVVSAVAAVGPAGAALVLPLGLAAALLARGRIAATRG
ncbi:hypothetical protein [Clavibacter phaseoli]|uniref:hypothetical protein n=2 Tax=Clavibacter phaseoli TaxID=1734031 RepID=UPI001F27A4A8|nr:hypothetical protein [Clavibacter phaseoli]UKF31590.1 hypothetical protein FGD69_11240 [Clavibacter phaseoli]UKF37510.1 hypothetical protein FGI33_10620 [Clavibacter phaseoli]